MMMNNTHGVLSRGSFNISKDTNVENKLTRGTRIVLYLKEDMQEYLEERRIKNLVKNIQNLLIFLFIYM